MQPKISVIVPVYKAEKYLHRCVDSILAQTFTDFELLLVNDGSPDNSGAICDEYAKRDSRIRVFHKENGGVSSARNIGLDNAKGEWITFIDSDDYIEQGYFEIPLDTTADLLIQNYELFNDENRSVIFKKSTVLKQEIQDFINTNIHKEWLRMILSKFFKSSLIKNNRIYFPKGITVGEDALFIQEYLYHTNSVEYIASAKYMYKCDNNYNRYKLSAKNAIDIFHRFIANYDKLNVDSIDYLDFAFNFFWGLTDPQKHNKENRIWYRDRIVKRAYKIVRKHRNLKWWIKYNLYKILS